MTRKTLIILLTFFCAISSCDKQEKKSKSINHEQKGAKDIVKIGDYSLVAKKSYKIISLIDSKDTLYIVTCSDYVFYPFGQVNNKSEIKTGLLKNFYVSYGSERTDIEEIEFKILKHENSKLIIYFDNDLEGSRHSYIYKGEIKDADVRFANGITIGMSKDDWLKTFFDYYPDELMAKYKYIILESCVQDITHTYTFRKNKLNSVNFVSDSYWNIDY